MRTMTALAQAALFSACMLCSSPSVADVPQTMNYQVMLTDDADQPLADQSVEIVFSLYDASSGGGLEWTETHNVTTNSIGVVSVILGSVTPLSPADFLTSLWLEVEVDGETLTPRRQLASSPYSLHAYDSDRLGATAASAYATDSELSTAGTINQPANPVDWTKLKNVPLGLADGTDDVGGAGDGYSLDADDGSPVDALYVASSGKVGIGTTNPQRGLHLHQIAGENAAYTYYTTTATGTTVNDGFIVGTEYGGLTYIMNKEDATVYLGTGGMSLMKFQPTGVIEVGSAASLDGDVEIYKEDSDDAVVHLSTDSFGGDVTVRDDEGNDAVIIEADNSGTGGMMSIRRDASTTGIDLNGNWAGSEQPALRVIGTGRGAYFFMNLTDDSSVQLPSNAVGSAEMLDEPGVAHSSSTTTVALTGGVDILVSRTITVPAAGYVLAIGSCNLFVIHSNGTLANVQIGVSNSSTTFPATQQVYQVVDDAAPSGEYDFAVASHDLFEVGNSGSYTYYYLADEATGNWHVDSKLLTLVYFRTAYGTVALARSDDEGPALLTEADVAAEQAEAKAFNMARLERELESIRSQLEAMKEPATP